MNTDLPSHIAIIMDGNGRWAKKRLVPKIVGHRAGAQALDKITKKADTMGIKHMTVYAFSTENWKRSKEEVNSLMNLMREYLNKYIDDNKNSNIKVDIIGDVTALESDIQEKIKMLEEISSKKQGMNLHIALNYGGRDEITRAVKNIIKDNSKGIIDVESLNEELISKYLDTKNIPDPELLIRTSGELRFSNFLLWQIAYTEFYFTDKLWPDFTIKDLENAISQYKNRDRRFGGRNEVQ